MYGKYALACLSVAALVHVECKHQETGLQAKILKLQSKKEFFCCLKNKHRFYSVFPVTVQRAQ
jgi:hypothetical protein